jgi:anaphase-promoting complex subunit 6
LAYCSAIDAIDPFCRTAGYVHVATLVGLNLKRRLCHLAHRLVDTDPKDSLAWFAVGSYYYACRRFDLAQRHLSRATRLDPSSAECWIGFGCSFAVCDESDQALALFRAAQNKYSGSSVPLLYMGMEYLRTNHLSLANHFLNSTQRTDPCDMLCCNELGVWCYRQGNLEDAAFWFMKALRLHLRAESSVLRSTDEGLGMDGYILVTGQPSTLVGGRADPASDHGYASTPHLQRRSISDGPPVFIVLCAVKTPSGKSIAATMV